MSFEGSAPLLPEIWERQNAILLRISRGGTLHDILADIVRLVEDDAAGGMRAAIQLVSEDGRHLVHGAAPSLPDAYNRALDGIAIGEGGVSCGVAAATIRAVYADDIDTDPRWSDFRAIALDHGLAACWSVPIVSSDGAVLGTYSTYHDTPRAPSRSEMAITQMIGQSAAAAIERDRYERLRERIARDRAMLTQELNHRVKNAFTISQSIVSMSAREADDPKELARIVNARLRALSIANDVAVSEGQRTDLATLLGKIMAPYAAELPSGAAAPGDGGPPVDLAPDAARSLALILHELATNAAKYGALSAAEGSVGITWRQEDDMLKIVWRETGGPAVIAPSEMGFGSRLIRDAVERQLMGRYEKSWDATGLVTHMDVPMSSLTAG